MTPTKTWTERYLEVALGSIPDKQRADVERELRSSITDAVDERVAGGEDAATAERAVLEGLGDPGKLAAAYTGRPNYLIGPELFPIYRFIVPRIIAVSVPVAALVLAALELVGGGTWADAMLAAISGPIQVALQIAFWGTLAFAILDRADGARAVREDILAKIGPWKLEHLPEPSPRRVKASEAAGELVSALIGFGAIAFVWAAVSVPGVNGPNGLFRNPDSFLPIILIALLARAALHVFSLAAGHWSTYMAVINTLLHLVFALPIVVLALGGQLVNPYFADGIGYPALPDATGLPMLLVAALTTFVTAWEIVRGFARARGYPTVGAIFRPSRPAA